MKRFFAFIFAILVAFSFSACNGNSQEANSDVTENSANNSVEEIYNDFLSGKITAVYTDGSEVDINDLTKMANPHPLTYALFDRNGDSIPELCINNKVEVITFWVQNGKLKFWCVESSDSKILSNGNCLATHFGGAPNHADYSYLVYSYTGNQVCSVTVSVLTKNDVDILENIYTQNVNIHNESAHAIPSHIEITKEHFDSVLESVEKIGEAKLAWEPIE
ncbi:MAG: hypothetical protein IKC10_01360 [Alphaproteobacteria bacterium]|nr:hypothetical protein [Alphaproteobacteria bacterium]